MRVVGPLSPIGFRDNGTEYALGAMSVVISCA